MTWLVVAYLAALAAIFVTALWTTDSFTNNVVRSTTTRNFSLLWQDPAYRTVILRTVGVAALVTVVCSALGVPMAFYMAKVASPRGRRILVVAVLTPLWASYLVKVYAWRVILQNGGVGDWLLAPLHLGAPGFGLGATVIVLSYLWLPYMILPVYAGLERLPDALLEASSDLGAPAWRTMRSIVLPTVIPAVVAGSVFTFSLSLGDYITVQIVGGRNQLLGNVIYQNFTLDLPFAAAVATVPVVVMVIYLTVVRRTGALESL